ncbi:hypothetical protein EK21DRAFT_28914, partial [Setomelanomma holmii]
KPFRLLDLPKELRLMVYATLTTTWDQCEVPLNREGSYYATLINPSLLGVRILATCRVVNDEAGAILEPKLARMLQSPPTMLLSIEQTIGLMDLKKSFFAQRNIFEKLVMAPRRPELLHAIDLHRTGHVTIAELRTCLCLSSKTSSTAVKAIASFMLQIAAFKQRRRSYATHSTHQTIAIAVSLPASFTNMLFTFSWSLCVRIVAKLFFGVTQPASVTGLADLSVLAITLIRDLACICKRWNTTSVC